MNGMCVWAEFVFWFSVEGRKKETSENALLLLTRRLFLRYRCMHDQLLLVAVEMMYETSLWKRHSFLRWNWKFPSLLFICATQTRVQ